MVGGAKLRWGAKWVNGGCGQVRGSGALLDEQENNSDIKVDPSV